MTLRDCETSVFLFESDFASRLKALGLQAGFSEFVRKSHGEAACVSRGEQLLGIRTLALFKPAMERVSGVVQNAARRGKRPSAAFQVALPSCPRSSRHKFLLKTPQFG